jgi:hypothetical protein
MIKVIKNKTEMREGSPIKVLTIEFDLEDIRNKSMEFAIEEFNKFVGEKISPNFSNILKCKGQ